MNGRAIGLVVAGLVVTAAWLRFAVPPLGAVSGAIADGPLAEGVFTLFVFAPILMLAIGGGRLCGIDAVAPGPAPMVASGRGGMVALAGLALATGYAALAGTLTPGSAAAASWVAPGLLVIGLQVAAEEAVFRGWMQPVLARSFGVSAFGVPAALAATAIAFAALHMAGGASGGIVIVNLLLGGVLFGTLAARDGGIAGALAAHWGWNAGEQLVLGLDPNPGTGAFGAMLDLDMVGAARWGGSADGLNGSVAMTLALLAVTVPHLWHLSRVRSGGGGAIPVDRVARPAEPR